MEAADQKSTELEHALREASEDGRWPIVFDTSPCAYRMKRRPDGRLNVQDSIEFIHDTCSRASRSRPSREPVVVHPVCSVRKMGTVEKLSAIAWALQPRRHRGERSALLRLRRRQGLQSSGAERARSTPSAASPSSRLHARLFVEPHLRDRAIRAGGLSLPLHHSSRRRVRKCVPRLMRTRLASHESSPLHSLLRRRLLSRGWHRDARAARASRRRGRLSAGADMLRTADGQQRMPR